MKTAYVQPQESRVEELRRLVREELRARNKKLSQANIDNLVTEILDPNPDNRHKRNTRCKRLRNILLPNEQQPN